MYYEGELGDVFVGRAFLIFFCFVRFVFMRDDGWTEEGRWKVFFWKNIINGRFLASW